MAHERVDVAAGFGDLIEELQVELDMALGCEAAKIRYEPSSDLPELLAAAIKELTGLRRLARSRVGRLTRKGPKTMTVLHIDSTPPRKPEDAGKTDGEVWNENMLAMMRSHFPWKAKPDAGRWYLYDSMGACLAKFNLDSGHGSRLAAAAPAMLVTLETVERELPQGSEFDSLRSLVRSANLCQGHTSPIYTALNKT